MKIGVFSTFMSPLATPQMIRDFGRRAEDIGLDSIWMGEHVALFDRNTFGYPGSTDGRIPVPPGGGMLDVVATFGFLAAATSKLRLGTGVALVPQRNPIYTAKEVCTLDWLTGWTHRFRHRRRLEQGGSRGLRLSLGRSRRALRRVPGGHATAVDRAGGRLRGKVGEVRDLPAGSQADPEAARADHRRRLCRGGLASGRAFRRRLVWLQSRSGRPPRRCSTDSMRHSRKPVESAARSSRSSSRRQSRCRLTRCRNTPRSGSIVWW